MTCAYIRGSAARLLSKLGSAEAEFAWRALIVQNPDCYDYYRGFLATRGVNLGVLLDTWPGDD